MTREEAWQGLSGYALLIAKDTDLREAIEMAIEALKAEPVRCDECKHHNECCGWTIPTNPDGYCSDGERRTDEA